MCIASKPANSGLGPRPRQALASASAGFGAASSAPQTHVLLHGLYGSLHLVPVAAQLHHHALQVLQLLLQARLVAHLQQNRAAGSWVWRWGMCVCEGCVCVRALPARWQCSPLHNTARHLFHARRTQSCGARPATAAPAFHIRTPQPHNLKFPARPSRPPAPSGR